MGTSSVFTMLCRELSRRAIPALRGAGFQLPPQDFGRKEMRYDFKRQAPDGWHVLSILFDRYRHPHFSVQIYIEPKSGMEHLIATGGTLLVGYVRARYRPWPLNLATFRADRPYWQRALGLKGSREAEAVTAFLELMPEIETWWKSQVSSKHVLTEDVAYQGTQCAA